MKSLIRKEPGKRQGPLRREIHTSASSTRKNQRTTDCWTSSKHSQCELKGMFEHLVPRRARISSRSDAFVKFFPAERRRLAAKRRIRNIDVSGGNGVKRHVGRCTRQTMTSRANACLKICSTDWSRSGHSPRAGFSCPIPQRRQNRPTPPPPTTAVPN